MIDQLFTPARVISARVGRVVDEDGTRIIEGKFGIKPLVIENRVHICETFANCDGTPEAIRKFTTKYGPLRNPIKPGDSFRFREDDWRACQSFFRHVWRMTRPPLYSSAMLREGKFKTPADHGFSLSLSRRGSSIAIGIQGNDLWSLIDLCFYSLPLERVRFCPAEGCLKPYFFATHLRQNYCGDELCIRWGELKFKREYWDRNKDRIKSGRNKSGKEE